MPGVAAHSGTTIFCMNPDCYLRTFDVLNLLVQHKEGLQLTEIKAALALRNLPSLDIPDSALV